MIQAIMKIGRWVGEQNTLTGSIENFIQNPNEKGNIHKVIKIIIVRERDTYEFQNVEVEELRERYIDKYLYRRGSSSGADVTPTAKLAGDITKTFKNKILRSLQDIVRDSDLFEFDDKEREQLTVINEILIEKSEMITEQLEERAKELDKKEGAILTFVVRDNDAIKYIGDFELFRKVLITRAKEKYFSQYGKKSLGKNQRCLVCQNKQAEVYGFVNTYNFYTADKPGFVTGGFRQQDAWKNYPVCFDCACNLELGKNYLNENLRFDFYGFRYLLIPKPFSTAVMADSFNVFEDIFEHRASDMINTRFEQQFINRLTNAEDEILEFVSEEKDYISFDFLFYREKQAAFNILLHVEDIVPSRLRKLFDIKKKIDAIDIFEREVSKKDGKRTIFFNMGILRNFFPYVSKTQSYDKHFLELTGKIFSRRPIDHDVIMKAIVRKLRANFVQDQYFKIDCLRGYMLLNYLAILGILHKGGQIMDIKPIEDLNTDFWSPEADFQKKAGLFFDAHQGFFSDSEKKVCFLVGLLVQKLLNIQWVEKNAAPFRSKLQGLRLNESLIKKVFYNAQEKLEQYKKNYYRDLESLISQYMITAGPKWKLTNDEISFYFTLGMNLADLFKTKKEDEDNDRPE